MDNISVYKQIQRILNSPSIRASMEKRAQTAMEYLLIIGFTMVIIAVIMVVFSQQNTEQRFQVQDSQINRIGNALVSAAEEVYYIGEPARRTVTVYMPSNIDNISIAGNELLFNAQLGTSLNQLEFPSDVPLTGNISATEGKKHIVVIAQPERVCIVEQGDEECIT